MTKVGIEEEASLRLAIQYAEWSDCYLKNG
jgi:hypothetical protein